MAKHYYAAYYPYSTRVVCNEYNPATIFVFNDSSTRDEFVNRHNDPCNPKYESISADERRRIDKFAVAIYTHDPEFGLISYDGQIWR